MATKLYTVGNWPMVTTAPPSPVATGTSTITLLQIKTGSGNAIRVKAWGFDGNADTALTPGVVELLATGTTAATVTAHIASGVQPYNDPNAAASSVTLSATGTGYTATGEGTTPSTTRSLAVRQIAPSGLYFQQEVLGDEAEIPAGGYILRIRATFGTTVSALCWVIYEDG